MKIKRRNFIKSSLAAGASLAVPNLVTELAAVAQDMPQGLPWQREIPLREAAKSVVLEGALNAQGPEAGGFGGGGGVGATTINNLKMKTAIWGLRRESLSASRRTMSGTAGSTTTRPQPSRRSPREPSLR
jgi:TAT (twin-arginine translocation) pathway signal sequence